MRPARLVPIVALAVACSGEDDSPVTLPYRTTFTTVGDTTVASTTGEVPDSLLRHYVVEWKVAGAAENEPFGEIGQIAVAADGKVWVWDGATPGLYLLDANGTLIRRVGRRGSGPGEYQRVNDIAVARDGALVMWDEGNARINIYNADGSFRATANLGFSDCCGLPLVVDTANRIWVMAHPRMIEGKEKGIDPEAMKKQEVVAYFRYDSTGAPIDTVPAPLLPGADGLLTAFNVTKTSFGGAARTVPYGTQPIRAVSPLGHIVSLLTRPYAVHTDADGKHVRLTRDFTPVPIPEEERAQERARIEYDLRRVIPSWTWNGPEIPREKPPITDLLVGLDGRIWVQLHVASESFEHDEGVREPGPMGGRGGEPPPPPVKFREKGKLWDVFEPDGRYLGRIVVPREISTYAARGNQVWGVLRDADDVPTLVRIRVDKPF